MTFRVLVAEPIGDAGLQLLRTEPNIEVEVATKLNTAELHQQLRSCHGLVVRSGTSIGPAELQHAPLLKVIVRAGTGIDNVDLDAATARGIVVMNTPGGNTIAAAEHTMALLLARARRVTTAHQSLCEGRWDREHLVGWELHGKVLGIIGFGRIGREVALRAQAFRMEVVAYDPFISKDAITALGARHCPLDELLPIADVVTLHVPLVSATKSLIGANELARMKRGATLVNCARGELVDEVALLAALDSGQLGGAAIDAFSNEPHPSPALVRHRSVVATPHLGASTTEAKESVGIQAARQVIGVLTETSFENAINVPIRDAAVLHRMRPFLALAEKIGALQAQIVDSGVREVEIELAGQIEDSTPIRLAFLRGLLSPIVGSAVNYVNAPYLAEQRGIRVVEIRSTTAIDYTALLTTRIRTDADPIGAHNSVVATVIAKDSLRIIELDGFRTDAIPSGELVILRSRDRPGVIGRIGVCFGSHGCNISEFRLGRKAPGDEALSVITVDEAPSPAVIAALESLDDVISVRKVALGAPDLAGSS